MWFIFQARELEKTFRAPIHYNTSVSSIEFDATLLGARKRIQIASKSNLEPMIPCSNSVHEQVRALMVISILERHLIIDWGTSKLGNSRRSLQRSLEAEGYNLSLILDCLLQDRVVALLSINVLRLAEIAFQLEYSDGAHFTRAFMRWTGLTPSQNRRMITNKLQYK